MRNKKVLSRGPAGALSKPAALCILLLGGCYSVEYPESYPCSAAAPGCPQGQVCNGSRCVAGDDKRDSGPGDSGAPDQTVKPSICGDDAITGEEVCDGRLLADSRCESHGFEGGELRCAMDCRSFDTSGCTGCTDGRKNDAEECDGEDLGGVTCQTLGFSGGPLRCTAACQIDASGCTECNDGQLDPEEDCDLQDFRGVTCEDRGYAGGWLSCSDSCTIDESQCSDSPCNHDMIKDPAEQCDGDDFGADTCESFGFHGGGDLVCADCLVDTSSCLHLVKCNNNNIREPGEQCDGQDFGPDSCLSYGYNNGGSLTCDGNCNVGFSQCCSASLTECSGECVDLLTDSRFCSASGLCGPGCGVGYVCNGAGACVLDCQAGLTECDGQCVNTSDDPTNCGGCDGGIGVYSCVPGTEACVNGTCQTVTYVLPTSATDVSIGANSVLVSGTRAYITMGGTSFQVLDLSNPLSPQVLGSVNHGYTDLRVEAHAIHDNVVWCIRSSSGGYGAATHVFGVDVSDPKNPVLRGSLTLQTTTSLLSRVSLIHAGYLLVHDYSDNLIYVIDISNPDAPTTFSSWGVPNTVNGGPGWMMVEGNLLYLPCGENFTLRIYDLSNLAAVTQVGVATTPNEQPFGNAVKIGSYVYVETNVYLGDSFLRVIDVSNPASPAVVGSVPSVGNLRQRKGKLFAFSYGPTVSAISLADPVNPVVEASSTVLPPPPSTSLNVYPLADPGANWVGNYLIGMTSGSEPYHGVRALNFPVN